MNAEVQQIAGNEPIESKMVGRLAQLLLNPSLDRCDIADGILGDRHLINFLSGFQRITIENFCSPGTNWMTQQQGDHDVDFTGHALKQPRDHFVMPLLLGSLCDYDGRPWYQSSVYEFLPAIDGIQTSNIGGKPMFKANLRSQQRSSFRDLARAIGGDR